MRTNIVIDDKLMTDALKTLNQAQQTASSTKAEGKA